MEAVYKLNISMRGGQIYGLFVAKTADVTFLFESGMEIHFGEILGKHSDVYLKIDQNDIELVSDLPEVVDVIKNHNLETGIDPFYYPVYLQDLSEGDQEKYDNGDFDDWTMNDWIKYKRG